MLVLRRYRQEDGVSLKQGRPLVHRGLVEYIRGVIVLTMTWESHLSRHEGKCEGLSGMHQSADSIKGPFHWVCTPLLTLELGCACGWKCPLPAIDRPTALSDTVLLQLSLALVVQGPNSRCLLDIKRSVWMRTTLDQGLKKPVPSLCYSYGLVHITQITAS